MLGFKQLSPPSDEGGGFCEAKDEGREGVKLQENATFSLPQSRYARQLPRQREPNVTPTFAREPIYLRYKDNSRMSLNSFGSFFAINVI